MFQLCGDTTGLLSMLVSFRLPFLVRLLSNSWFIHQFTWFLLQINPLLSATVCYCVRIAQMRSWRGGLGWGRMGDVEVLLDLCAKLSWHVIYCSNLRPDAGSQSVSLSLRGLGIRAPKILREYHITTVIAIRLFTHPRTCGIGLSILSATSQLQFEITTRFFCDVQWRGLIWCR